MSSRLMFAAALLMLLPARHEIERLRVGAVAPDFELADQDDVRFELSDYRRSVVVLDLWGFV